SISVIDHLFPLFHVTSIACLIARSTREVVVEYLLAISGYKIFVIDPNNSISLYTIVIASLRYIYPLICAGTPISCIIDVILVSKLCSFLGVGDDLGVVPTLICSVVPFTSLILSARLLKSNGFKTK